MSREFSVHPDVGKDAIDHEATAECVCGPTTVPLPTADGEIWWVHMHHGLAIGEMADRDAYIDQMREWAARQDGGR